MYQYIIPKNKENFSLFNNIKDESLMRMLNRTKNLINNIDINLWNKIRKMTNVYEDPGFYEKNLKNKVISRAFYKLWEIMEIIDIKVYSDSEYESLHLCDAPGGFTQATVYSTGNKLRAYNTISLKENVYEVPVYNRRILKEVSSKIKIANVGKNNDITDIQTAIGIIKKFRNSNIKFITADGGIMENSSQGFNDKEVTHLDLISWEIFISLNVLEEDGVFVIKFFDIFTDETKKIIYFLSKIFAKTRITKPSTSRPTNSEKYILCEGFLKKKFISKIKNDFYKAIVLKDFDFLNRNTFIDKHINKVNNDLVLDQIKNIKYNLCILSKNRDYSVDEFYRKKKNVFCRNFLIKSNILLCVRD